MSTSEAPTAIPAPEPAAAPAPAETPNPEPAERPDSYYVLSDSHGFVGAFYSAADAEGEVLKYRLVPFLVQRFGVAPGPVGTIWVVLYRDLDAVAFVSNSRAEAERVQKVYGRVGLTYVDSIDYWEHPANKIATAAAQRLESLSRAHTMYAGAATLEELQARELEDYERISRLMLPKMDGPIGRVLRENEKITILDCVVPVDIGGEAPAGAATMAADEAAANAADEAADEAAANAADETPVATRAEAPVAADQ